MGQVHKKYTPDAGITQIAYNQSGQVILEVDSDGKYTAYAYDAFGRMIKQVDAPSDNGLLADNGSPWITDPSLHALVTLVNTSPREKEWFYELIDPASMPRIHTSVIPYLSALNDTRGRIVQTVSYDEGGVPVEYKFFSYDNDGFVDWEMVQLKTWDSAVRAAWPQNWITITTIDKVVTAYWMWIFHSITSLILSIFMNTTLATG
ncbi:MAG: RHS repeat protein [Saprospiraceae bacterium]|nr:RHS repeat protein [Saprospiraceae bacterium]